MAAMPINITNVITKFGTYLAIPNTFLCSTLAPLLMSTSPESSVDDNERMQQTEVSSRKTAMDDEIPTDGSGIVANERELESDHLSRKIMHLTAKLPQR